MKRKLLFGLAGLLLTGSTMFAGWGIDVGFGNGYGYYGPPRPAYVAPPYRYGYVPRYRTPGYFAVLPPPLYATPYAGYVAVAPVPPFYGAVWIGPRWAYGPRGRYWAPGYWSHRRY